MTEARSGWTSAALAVGALVLTAGCGVTDPPDSTSVSSRSEYSKTSSHVNGVLTRAVESATAAVGGSDLNGARKATTTTCGEIHPRRFRQLESLGSFLTTSYSVEAATERIESAWQKEGWDVKQGPAGVVRLTDATPTGVDFRMEAELRQVENDPSKVFVSLSLRSDCLELSDDVLDHL